MLVVIIRWTAISTRPNTPRVSIGTLLHACPQSSALPCPSRAHPQAAGFADALGPDFVGTVFAPTDAAFEKVTKLAESLKLELTPELIAQVLVSAAAS